MALTSATQVASDLAPPVMLHCESALDAEEQRGDVSS
jgi:hypothetical protein